MKEHFKKHAVWYIGAGVALTAFTGMAVTTNLTLQARAERLQAQVDQVDARVQADRDFRGCVKVQLSNLTEGKAYSPTVYIEAGRRCADVKPAL